MDIKKYISIIFFIIPFAGYAQGNGIASTAKKIHKDSVVLKISNTTLSDTFRFSIYKQQYVGKKWITNDYDVFCDPSNPNTTILRIVPKELVSQTIALGNFIYSSEIRQKGTRVSKKATYRFLIKASTTRKPEILLNFYSNTL